jgi:hypothetical protein
MKPGDHVVLVDDDWTSSPNEKSRLLWRHKPEIFPVRGTVYTVRLAIVHPELGLHIKLEELSPNGDQPHWGAHRFRKLNKLTPETFQLTKELIS